MPDIKFLHQAVRYDNTLNRSIFEKQVFERAGFKLPTPTALSYTIETSRLPKKILSSLPCSRFISINVGGGNTLSNATNRLWPKEYFFRLINILKEPVVLLGQGSPDEDIGKWIEKQNSGRLQIRNLINKTTLDQTAEIIHRSDLYIGNDSALMFLAAAVNTASLGLYGPTQAEVASPLGQNVYFLEATGECVRCYDPDDGIEGRMYTCNNNICMQSIPPEHVAACARSILEHFYFGLDSC